MIVLVVMSVLMILGTAMLSLALSSYKFRALEQNKKTSLYASEAGLDEAYEIMGKFVQYGIEQGNKAVGEYDKNFESLIKVERYKVEHEKPSDYIDKDGIITNSTVADDRKRVFEEGYKVSTIQSSTINYMEDDIRLDINCYDKGAAVTEKGYKDFIETGLSSGQGIFSPDDKLSQGGINNLVKQLNSYLYKINVALDDKKENIKVDAKKITEIFDGDNPIVIRIKSSYTHNSIPKIISATYEINIAKYNVQYNLLPTQIVKIPKNPMWSKALMVNGDMRINGGNVTIGNVNEGGASDANNTGIYVAGKETGIDLNNSSSILKVIGNVVTNKKLILSYNGENTSENKNVDVTGNIYARNVIIDKNTVTQGNGTSVLEAKGGKIYTSKIDDIRDGSVYIMDDLEINGEKSTVDIAGSYYGVSDGSEGARNNHDNSSSIIINTEDIGNRVDKNNNILTNNSALTIGKNVYIAGTSYINLSNNIKYQTGESISIVGNYRAYTEPLTNPSNTQFREDNVIFDYLDPLTLVTRYAKNEGVVLGLVKVILEKDRYITVSLTDIGNRDKEIKDAYSYKIIYDNKPSKIVPIGKTVKLDAVIIKPDNGTNNPIVTVELYKEDNSLIKAISNVTLISSVKLNAFDKSKYFEEYYKQFPTENGLNLGEGIIFNKNIPDASKPENIHAGSIFTSQNRDDLSSGNWNIDLDRKIKARSIQLKNQLFYMGKANDYESLLSTTNIDYIQDTINTIDNQYYEIDDKTDPVVTIEKNIDFAKLTTRNEVNNNEVIILEKDQNSTYVLKGKNASNTPVNSTVIDLLSGNEYKGIIITKGNIIISGNLNFKGTIICNGDLTFEGAGEKKITYDKAYLENFALNNYKLFRDVFSDVGKYGRDNANNYLFAKVYDNVDSPSVVDDKFKLIKRKKWELIK